MSDRPTPTRGTPVELGGRTRYLRFTLKTIREMREKFGNDLDKGLQGDQIADLLWYGLRADDPELTLMQVEEMVDLRDLTTVVTALSKALGYAGKVETRPQMPAPAKEQAAVGGDASSA